MVSFHYQSACERSIGPLGSREVELCCHVPSKLPAFECLPKEIAHQASDLLDGIYLGSLMENSRNVHSIGEFGMALPESKKVVHFD